MLLTPRSRTRPNRILRGVNVFALSKAASRVVVLQMFKPESNLLFDGFKRLHRRSATMLHTTNATNDAPVLTFFDAEDIFYDEILLMFVKL